VFEPNINETADQLLFVPTVEAVGVLRPMRGGAMSYLMEGGDGNYYIVKFRNNPQNRRVLINELIASVIMWWLRISTPRVAFILVTSELIKANSMLRTELPLHGALASPGLHFGSRFPGRPDHDVVYDFLPRTLLTHVLNIEDFYGALVLDKWAGSIDARQAIFVRVAPPTPRPGFVAHMIDNGQLFGGKGWRFDDLPLHGRYLDHAVYMDGIGMEAFAPWLKRVMAFPPALLFDTIENMPRDWLQTDEMELKQLLARFLLRRNRLPELLSALDYSADT